MRPRIALPCLLLFLSWLPDAAAAEEKRDERPPPSEQTPDDETDEKRQEPDYDGRGDSTTTGDALLWIPRVLLAPPYFVSEYLLRRPLGFVIAESERAGIPVFVYDLFTFGQDHKIGIFPVVFYALGFRPSIGIYAFWDDAFVPKHELRLRGAYGGTDWLAASFASRTYFGDDPVNLLAFEGATIHRPDYAFYGIGPDTEKSDEVRYGKDTLEGRMRVEKGLWRESSFRADVGVRDVDFFRGGYGDRSVLDDAVASGALPEPPGYSRGYTTVRSGFVASLDTRLPRPAPGSGLRIRGGGVHSAELRETGSYWMYGGSVTGFLDLNDLHRVVSLTAMTRMVDAVGDTEVPFTELVTLGGSEPMRGFFPGRLTGQSAAVVDLAYEWPIWIWLDGAMHFEIGNVFGKHLTGFELEKFRWSGSLGIQSAGVSENPLQIMLGVGSETFESGGGIDTIRFVLGTTSGF